MDLKLWDEKKIYISYIRGVIYFGQLLIYELKWCRVFFNNWYLKIFRIQWPVELTKNRYEYNLEA